MKVSKIILGVLVVFCSCQSDAPISEEDNTVNGLEEQGVTKRETTLSEDIAAYKTVLKVVRETELTPNFIIVPGDVDKAKSYIANDERVLAYNPDFITELQKQAEGDTSWQNISVLARQIGHHLSEHEIVDGKVKKEDAIEADKYAGFVLFKMGASMDDAIAALKESTDDSSSTADLSINTRVEALMKGWEEARMIYQPTEKMQSIVTDSVSGDSLSHSIANADTMKSSPVNINKGKSDNTVYQVIVVGDSTIYRVDDKNQIFSSLTGNNEVIGYKEPSTKPGFDWVFSKQDQKYGVDTKGRLWARSMEGEFKIVGQAVKIK